MGKSTKLDKQIGEAIELHRKIKNKSRKELGEKIGVCYQQVQNYEEGHHQITMNRLSAISKALKVSFLAFLPKELIDKKVTMKK